MHFHGKKSKNDLSCHSGESRNPGKQALLDPGFRRGDGFHAFKGAVNDQCEMINDQ